MATDQTIPYATPHRRRWTDWAGRWLSRRAATSGQRLIALAIMALVGVACESQVSNYYPLLQLGQMILTVACILFAVEYVMSFFQ